MPAAGRCADTQLVADSAPVKVRVLWRKMPSGDTHAVSSWAANCAVAVAVVCPSASHSTLTSSVPVAVVDRRTLRLVPRPASRTLSASIPSTRLAVHRAVAGATLKVPLMAPAPLRVSPT